MIGSQTFSSEINSIGFATFWGALLSSDSRLNLLLNDEFSFGSKLRKGADFWVGLVISASLVNFLLKDEMSFGSFFFSGFLLMLYGRDFQVAFFI